MLFVVAVGYLTNLFHLLLLFLLLSSSSSPYPIFNIGTVYAPIDKDPLFGSFLRDPTFGSCDIDPLLGSVNIDPSADGVGDLVVDVGTDVVLVVVGYLTNLFHLLLLFSLSLYAISPCIGVVVILTYRIQCQMMQLYAYYH